MSTTTTADEKLQNAKEEINSAIKNLSEIVINQVWGYDEYREEYFDKMQSALTELLKIRKSLG